MSQVNHSSGTIGTAGTAGTIGTENESTGGDPFGGPLGLGVHFDGFVKSTVGSCPATVTASHTDTRRTHGDMALCGVRDLYIKIANLAGLTHLPARPPGPRGRRRAARPPRRAAPRRVAVWRV